jgi:hypothetical protein
MHLAEPTAVADAFAKHFQSIHSNCCSINLPRLSQCSQFLSLAPVSDADVCKAIKTLKPSKSVGLDDIPGFIIKGSSAIFILTQQYIPAAWKKAAVVPVFKRGNHAATRNYRRMSIINNFSKLFEFIIHVHVSHYAKFYPNQHGF